MPWTDFEIRRVTKVIQKEIEQTGWAFYVPGPRKYDITNLPDINVKQFNKISEALKLNIRFVMSVSTSEQNKEGDKRKVDFIFITSYKPDTLFAKFDEWITDSHKKAASEEEGKEFINFTSSVRGLLKSALEQEYQIKITSKVLN